MNQAIEINQPSPRRIFADREAMIRKDAALFFGYHRLIKTKAKERQTVSVVILGGNECMERRYMDLCQSYRCRAKVFIKPVGGLKNKLGDPDLTIFFTSTMSHKMVQSALRELKSCDTVIERCHTSSLSALRNILEKHAG